MTFRNFLLCLAGTGSACAHHGRDFLLVQDADLPVSGQWYLFSNYGWASQPGPDEQETDLGLSTGLLPRTAFTTTLQYADRDGNGWGWNSVTTSLQFDLTPSRPDFPLKLGLILGRNFSLDGESAHAGSHDDDDDHEEDHDAEHDHDLEAYHGEVHHDDADPVADHDDDDHEHRGIHQHGVDAYFAKFIVEAPLGNQTKLAGNIIGLFPDDGERASYGYALGIRHSLHDKLALGVEFTGDFESNLYQEGVAAAYYSPVHSLMLKVGVGAGLNSASPDLTVHSGLVWKF